MELTIAVVVLAACALLFRGCAHRRTTRPRKDEEGAYVRCLGCGSRIATPLWDMDEA